MPRPPRILLQGGCYHILNRGNARKQVFHGSGDYRAFLALVDRAQERLQLRLMAYCLMPNHFHLVASQDGRSDISHWMHWLTSTHSHRYNLRYGTSGCVWQGRFKAFPMKDDAHLLTVIRYVERNALRSGLVAQAEKWPWGSLAERLRRGNNARLLEPPIPLPPNWLQWVNTPQTATELEAVRHCVNRQRPFGDDAWIATHVSSTGFQPPTRRPGRPRETRTR